MKSQTILLFSYDAIANLKAEMIQVVQELIQALVIDWSQIKSGEKLFDGECKKDGKNWQIKITTFYQNPNTGVCLVWNISGEIPGTKAVMNCNSHQSDSIWHNQDEVWRGPLDYDKMLKLGIVKNKALERPC